MTMLALALIAPMDVPDPGGGSAPPGFQNFTRSWAGASGSPSASS
jgi:hypothetical protein